MMRAGLCCGPSFQGASTRVYLGHAVAPAVARIEAIVRSGESRGVVSIGSLPVGWNRAMTRSLALVRPDDLLRSSEESDNRTRYT